MALDNNFFKSSYDQVFPDNIYDLIPDGPGDGGTGGVDADYADPYDQVVDESKKLFPHVDGLSEEESQKLNKYKTRLRRLHPARAPERVGSPTQPGNPYSIDTRGALEGLTGLGTAIVNKKRADRVYGNENKAGRASRGAQLVGKLGDLLGSDGLKKVQEKSRDRRAERYAGFDKDITDLENKKQIAADQKKNRQEYLTDNVGKRVENKNERKASREELATKEQGKAERDQAQIDAERKQNKAEREFEAKQNRLDRQNKLDAIAAKESIDGGGDKVSSQILEGQANLPKGTINSIDKQINTLQSHALSESERKQIEPIIKRLNGYKTELNGIAIDIYNNGGINDSLAQRIKNVNNAIQSKTSLDSNTGGGNNKNKTVSDYASQYDLTYDEAKKILKNRGVVE